MTTETRDSARFIATNRLERYDLVNQKGEDLGQVTTFVADMLTGRLAFAIVAFGGFFGLNDKWFAVPWDIMTWSPEQQKFVVDMPHKVLESAPGMDKDNWVQELNTDFLARCYIHYGLAPYWDSDLSPEEQKRQLAYAIWRKEGEPEGSADRHYYRAQHILTVQGVIGPPSGGAKQPEEDDKA